MEHPLIGKRVVVRAPSSGVFFGKLSGRVQDEEEIAFVVYEIVPHFFNVVASMTFEALPS
jgi:hypothetical protein